MNKDYSENELLDEENAPISEAALKHAVSTKEFMDKVKKTTTIRLKTSTIFYFQQMSEKTNIPYQTLINMYLDDCAKNGREIRINWN